MPCSQAARDSGDDPAGSAAEFSSFLLLEHREAWSANAADDAVAALDPTVAAAVDAHPGLRAFAIRSVHPRRHDGSNPSYLGRVGPEGYVVPVPATPTALNLDVLDDPPASGSTTPIFAVCTNGKRDRCCAIVGRGVAVGLHQQFGDRVVEISHLGGHRYAGTMLVLPWGYAYGFLDLAAASDIAAAARDGLVHPEGLRGRADLAPAAQAAEVLLRRELGPATPAAVRVESVAATPSTAEVHLTVNDHPVTVHLMRESGPVVVETLCGGKPFGTGRWRRA